MKTFNLTALDEYRLALQLFYGSLSEKEQIDFTVSAVQWLMSTVEDIGIRNAVRLDLERVMQP